jgi:hypothetical protein
MFFATDDKYVKYADATIEVLTKWAYEDILSIQSKLLERTKVLFYPRSSVGSVKAIVNGNQTVVLDAEQSLSVTVFVDHLLADNVKAIESISSEVSRYIDAAISQTKFTVSQLESDLKASLGPTVYGVSIKGIGGARDYRSVSIEDRNNRLCIKRVLKPVENGLVTVVADIGMLFSKL